MVRISIASSLAIAGLAVSSLAVATPASANDDLELWPTSQWAVEEFDDKCRLARSFGAGEDRTMLWVEKGSIGAAFNMTLIGRPFRHPFGSKISVQFAPEPEYHRAYLTTKSSQGRPVVSLFGVLFSPTSAEIESDEVSADTEASETVDYDESAYASTGQIGRAEYAERFGAINRLRLGGALMEAVTLRTGPLEKPFASLGECTQRLDARINRNTEEAATPTEPVDLERWAGIIQQNYPLQMLREEEEGRIGVRLTVGTDGRVSYCEVLSVVGPTSFNDTVCLLMLQHATFEPARAEDGEPLVSRYQTRVTFRLN